MKLKQFLIIPHIPELIMVSAETPEQAVSLWLGDAEIEQFHTIQELPAIAQQAGIRAMTEHEEPLP